MRKRVRIRTDVLRPTHRRVWHPCAVTPYQFACTVSRSAVRPLLRMVRLRAERISGPSLCDDRRGLQHVRGGRRRVGRQAMRNQRVSRGVGWHGSCSLSEGASSLHDVRLPSPAHVTPDDMLIKADIHHRHTPEEGAVRVCEFRGGQRFDLFTPGEGRPGQRDCRVSQRHAAPDGVYRKTGSAQNRDHDCLRSAQRVESPA